MGKSKTLDEVQFAALPFRVADDGLRVMLLTSRETQRWVIPKGWPMRGRKPREAAAQEAFEEAGILGTIVGKRPVGSCHYSKRLSAHTASSVRCRSFCSGSNSNSTSGLKRASGTGDGSHHRKPMSR